MTINRTVIDDLEKQLIDERQLERQLFIDSFQQEIKWIVNWIDKVWTDQNIRENMVRFENTAGFYVRISSKDYPIDTEAYGCPYRTPVILSGDVNFDEIELVHQSKYGRIVITFAYRNNLGKSMPSEYYVVTTLERHLNLKPIEI